MDSGIYIGLVLNEAQPGFVNVWIPTLHGALTLGQFQYLYENTGGQLYGENLQKIQDSSVLCKVSSKITSGSWFKSLPDQGASVFDINHKDGNIYDYRIAKNYTPKDGNGLPPTISWSAANPALNLSVCSNILQKCGGDSIPNLGNLPQGDFARVQGNQWVVVAFTKSSHYPIVLSCLQDENAWKVLFN